MADNMTLGTMFYGVVFAHCHQNPVANLFILRQRQPEYNCDTDGRYTIKTPAVPFLTDGEANYLELCPDTEMVSFLPASAMDGAVINPWEHPKRQKGRIGRVVRKVLTPEGLSRCTGDDIEDFVTRVKAELALIKGTKVDLVSGPEIARYYGLDSDETTVGSCMQGQPEDWFDLYSLNSKVKLLVAVRPDGVMTGRALVWDTDNHGTVMDSVYGDGVGKRLLDEEADRRGWGTPDTGMTVSLEHARLDAYPYVDSFRHLNTDKMKLRVGWAVGYDTVLDSQDGGGMGLLCTSCGAQCDEDNTYWSAYTGPYCEECWSERSCGDCGEYIGYGYGDYCNGCLPDHTCRGCEEVMDHYSLTDGYCAACADLLCETCQEVKDSGDEVITMRRRETGHRYNFVTRRYDDPYTYIVTVSRCRDCEVSRLTDMVTALAAKADAQARADAIVYA